MNSSSRAAIRVLACVLASLVLSLARAQPFMPDPVTSAPSSLLAVDQNRGAVVEGIVNQWRASLQASYGVEAPAREAQLREALFGLRADRLLAASLSGTLEGLAQLLGAAPEELAVRPKNLGDTGLDVVYVPVTPCRLVETRGTFAAVYQGDGSAGHLPLPFTPNQTRNYTVQGGNGVCLAQLPGGLNAAGLQLQVFGIPTTAGSGDIEILPQGSTFGSTATQVYLGSLSFNSSSTTVRINQANNQIGVQVRGGGAHVALDVVGYFRAPPGGYVSSVTAGTGLTGGTITSTGVIAADPAYLQRRVSGTCAAGSSIRVIASDGTVTCEADDGGGGTVTSLSQGTGIALSTNPITTTGTISADTAYLQRRVSGTCAVGSSIRVINADGTVTCQTDGPANAFVQGGNAFGATAVLGTTDFYAVEVNVNGERAMRYAPATIPNLVGGSSSNVVVTGVRGGTIGGGGASGNSVSVPLGGVTAVYSCTGEDDCGNRVKDWWGTVAGGAHNRVGDGAGLLSDNAFATVGGGFGNSATAQGSTVGGGMRNEASESSSAIGGGFGNSASGNSSTVGGGVGNRASGYASVVVGGYVNEATGFASIAGGYQSEAAGDYSIALGRYARALGQGSVAIADGQPFDFTTTTDNRFVVRATGGVRFVVDIDGTGAITWSCLLTTGNGWNCASDRNLKQDLEQLDGAAVLDKLVAMPVYAWSPKGRNAHVRHYGPMAQDFHAAFGLGDDDKMIGMQDADGVALAAIQGLYRMVRDQQEALRDKLQERDAEVAALRAEVAALREAFAQLTRERRDTVAAR